MNYAYYYGDVSPTLINCTISGNRGSYGGGMSSYPYRNKGGTSNPHLTNCIVWGNIANARRGRDQVYGASQFINCNIAGKDGSSDWDTRNLGEVGNNIALDPLFVMNLDPGIAPSDGGDFHLQEESPAIDVGDNSVWAEPDAVDIEGNPRVIDIVDMGAYETDYQRDEEAPEPISHA